MSREIKFGKYGPEPWYKLPKPPKPRAFIYEPDFEPSNFFVETITLGIQQFYYRPLYKRYSEPGKVFEEATIRAMKKGDTLEKLRIFRKSPRTTEAERQNILHRIANVKKTLREALQEQERLDGVDRVKLFLDNFTQFFNLYGFWKYNDEDSPTLIVYSNSTLDDLQCLADLCIDCADEYKEMPKALLPAYADKDFEASYY